MNRKKLSKVPTLITSAGSVLAFGVAQSPEVSKVSPTISQECFLLIPRNSQGKTERKFECFKKKLEEVHALAWSPGNSTLLFNTWRRNILKETQNSRCEASSKEISISTVIMA